MLAYNRKKMELHPAKVINIKEITTDVFVIDIEKHFDFLAGQVIALAMKPDNEPRLYSIASGTNRDFVRILFDINPQGELTPPLSQVKPGDKLYVSQPFGKFISTDDEAWWIATGTGIAPYISMSESGFDTNKTLIHGARYIRQFYFSDYFQKQLGERYLRFCTAENAPGVYSGRLTDYLTNTDSISTDRKYYLCGNADMVVEVRDILIGKGVPYEQIVAEIYF